MIKPKNIHMEAWAWKTMAMIDDELVIGTFGVPDNLMIEKIPGIRFVMKEGTPVVLIHGEDRLECDFKHIRINTEIEVPGSDTFHEVVLNPYSHHKVRSFVHNVILEAYGQPKNGVDIMYDTIERMTYD